MNQEMSNYKMNKDPTFAGRESSYFTTYVEQKITQRKIPEGYNSLVFYSGPKNFADFQRKALQIIEQLVLYYQSSKQIFVTLSPWTCFINKKSTNEEIILLQEQLSQTEQINQKSHFNVSKLCLSRYMAPELFIDVFEPTIKSDIFSLGCLLLFLFDNSLQNIGWLFKGIHTEQDYIKFIKEKLPTLNPIHRNFYKQDCWNYIKKMASFNPEDRPNLEDIIQSEKLFPSKEFNIQLKIPTFKFKYYYQPWNGNQFDDYYNVGQPLLDSQQQTQYYLGQYKYSQTDVTIFKDSIGHLQNNSFKCFLPIFKVIQNKQIIVSNTCANYVDQQEYYYYQLLQTKETMEVDVRFNKFQLKTQRQATLLVFQFIFLRCILEEQRLFLADNTKFTFKFNKLLIAGPQFITLEEQENDFILQQLSTVVVDNQRIKYVIKQLMNNSISNYLALIMVGRELDEIVVNRDYFNNLIKRRDVDESLKDQLREILNYYHPKFMKRQLNILLHNFIDKHKDQFDTTYLEELKQECQN